MNSTAMPQAFVGLNQAQIEMASKVDGKFRVLAGAGSGKTHTLVRRNQYLLDCGISPNNIMSVSFTKKSSKEIQERLFAQVGEKALDIWMGTFHSVCARILMPNSKVLVQNGLMNVDKLTTLEPDDQYAIIKDLAQNNGFVEKEDIEKIKSKIDFFSNYGKYPKDLWELEDKDVVTTYADYISYKKNTGYIDFNDILNLTVQLLEMNPEILNRYARQFKYVMIDECQDLNNVQFRLLQLFSSYWKNYMIIGDDLQCIYSFRGSNVNNMIDIASIDPTIETILLERNYRSTKNIVQGSNAVVSHNKNQLEKVSFTENEQGSPIYVYNAPDESQEADFVTDMIHGLMRENGYSYKDFAVIYRSNYLSRQVEFAFTKGSIPYDVLNGSEFYDRKEIKDIVCYLRAIHSPHDDVAFERIINSPKRSIGETTLQRIKMYAADAEVPLSVAIQNVEDIPKINKPTKQRILQFSQLIKACSKYNDGENPSIYGLISAIIKGTKYLDQYDLNKIEDENRVENIASFSTIAMDYDEKWDTKIKNDETTKLGQFLLEVAMFNGADGKPEEEVVNDDKVTLTTAHSAKGLEFPVVFLIGMNASTFPSKRTETEEGMEEERRLAYVAMTRAEKILFVSYSSNRVVQNELVPIKVSRFVTEIPDEYKRVIGYQKKEEESVN